MRKDAFTPFSIYITKELRHKIREAAAKHDQEMAPWVVNCIESYLKFVEPSLPRPNPRPTKKSIEEARKAKRQEALQAAKEEAPIETPLKP
jgi:hypothetical protein